MSQDCHNRSHTIHCSEKTFRNMLLHDIDTLLHYYSVNYFMGLSPNNPEPISLPSDCSDMETILARFTLLLVSFDRCGDVVIRHDLSLIWQRLLTLSKIGINTIYIWMTDSNTPILAKDSPTFRLLPPTIKQLLLQTHNKLVNAHQPVPSGKESTVMLTNNLRAHIRLINLKGNNWILAQKNRSGQTDAKKAIVSR